MFIYLELFIGAKKFFVVQLFIFEQMVICMSAKVGANVVECVPVIKISSTPDCDWKECNMYYCVVALNLFIVFQDF